MKKLQNKKTKGIFYASWTAVMQGFEGVLFVFLGLFFLKNIFESFGFSIAILAIKELLIFAMVFLFVSPRRVIYLIKMLKTRNELRFFFYAGIFGTTIGNLSYIIAIQLAGAAYGVILTSLYPIFSITLNNLFFSSKKQKENIKVWIGILISVIGAILYIMLPSLIDHHNFSTKTIIGIIMGGCAGLFWAIEALFLNKGISQQINQDIKTIDGVVIRSFATVLCSCLFLLPLTISIHYLNTNNKIFTNPLLILENIFTNWKIFLVIFAVSLNVVFLRNVHLLAIKLIGAKLTAVIDTNNFLVTPLFSIFLVNTNLTFLSSSSPLFIQPIWWSWLLIIPIIVGIMIIMSYRHKIGQEEIEKII